MISEKKEKQILLISFIAGLIFAIAEFAFSIISHSQSALTDAVYDLSELVFIALLLFLTPLFHQPVSEKHPYGFYQVESIFVLIKGVMMASVSVGICAQVIESALSGGNVIDNSQVSSFQLGLGIVSIIIYFILNHKGKSLSSPAIEAELLGWKLDVFYSLGLAFAFFAANYLQYTSLAFIAPYFDQIVALIVMILMLPETLKVLIQTIKEIFLFPPDGQVIDQMKCLLTPVLKEFGFNPVFYDITKTGRHLWVCIYFTIEEQTFAIDTLSVALDKVNQLVNEYYSDVTCELEVVPEGDN